MTQTPKDWNLVSMEEDRDFWKCEFEREKARADAAEARHRASSNDRDKVYELWKAAEEREQRLKEAWEQLREIVSTNATGGKGEDINDYDIMLNMMDDFLYLATLYPDTPAPTPTVDDTKFLKTINEVWSFIKGDGSFTGPQLKEWSNGLDGDLCRQVLRVLIQTIWTDYGGKVVQEGVPGATPEITARPIDDWHEDFGDVLWWAFPVNEPPYCGSPMDMDWPYYHTHWTPIVIPAAPAPKEGVKQIKSIRPTTAVLSEEETQAFEATASDPEKTESIGMERVREKFQDFKGGRR